MPTHTYSKAGPGRKTFDEVRRVYTLIKQLTANNHTGFGMNDNEVAKTVGVSDRTVMRWRHANGVPDWRGKYPDDKTDVRERQ